MQQSPVEIRTFSRDRHKRVAPHGRTMWGYLMEEEAPHRELLLVSYHALVAVTLEYQSEGLYLALSVSCEDVDT